MCYTHVLTQDPERLLEEEPDATQRERSPSKAPGPQDPPEPMPEPDPTEPLRTRA